MRKKALRALKHGGKAVGLGGVFVSAALAGVVLHANQPRVRRLVANVANDAIGTLFQGRLAIGELQELELGATGHVHVAEAEITDPEQKRVIHAKGIDARIDLKKLVGSLVRGKTPVIDIDAATIDDAEVILDFDAQGEINIARAFLPRPSTTPKPTPTHPDPLAEDVRLSIKSAYVHHAWVHGNLVPPKLDADGDEVRAHVFIFDNRLSVKVDEARTTLRSPRVPGQVGDVHGTAKGELGVPLAATRQDIVMHWELVGDGAGIPLTAHLKLEKDRLTTNVDIAEAKPELVRGAFPFLPLSRPLELHAVMDGDISKPLAITANGRIGDALLTATGDLAIQGDQPFHIDADLTRVDAAAFAGPASDVSGHVHAEGAIAGGAPSGTFTIATKEGTFAAQRSPAIRAEGRFDEKHVEASFKATQGDAANGTQAEGEVTLLVPEQKLTFDVRAQSKNLRALVWAPNVVSGSGTARATGTLDLATHSIDAHVIADGGGIAREPASAQSVHADATVTGPLQSPIVDVTARAANVTLAAAAAPKSGPKTNANDATKKPLTYPSATAHARIVLVPTPRVLGASVHVDAAEDGVAIDASATEIILGGAGGSGGAGSDVEVRGAKITGLGAPIEADVHVQNGVTSVRARGSDLDMKRLAAMTGIQQLRLLPEGSRGALDIDLRSAADRTDGHLDVTITGARDGTAAEVHAKLAGKHVVGTGRFTVGTMGWVEIQGASLELPRGLSLASMKRATGAMDLRGEIDLSQGAALLGGESIETMTGIALLAARIERGDPDNLPTVYASARTQGLDVTFNRAGISTHVGGLDVALSVGHDGATEDTEASALVWDASGVVASADAKARLPLAAWITGTQAFDRDAIAALDLSGVVDVPERRVAALPGIFARPDLDGTVSAHAHFAGSITNPRVQLVAQGTDLAEKRIAGAARGPRYAPVDGTLQAHWNGKNVVATLALDERERVQPADVAATTPAGAPRPKPREAGHVRSLMLARAPADDLFAGRPLDWDASAELDVADLELAPLPLPLNIRGVVTGRMKLRDLATAPQLSANATVEGLTIGGAKVALTDVKVEAKNGSLDAHVRVNQNDGGSGRLNVVSKSLKWLGVDVAWDDEQPTQIDYKVDKFRLAIVRPFVRTVIPEIDGQVDGKGSATIDSKKQVFEGGLALTGGRLYVNAIGEEITDVGAVAHFESDGAFRIEEATGKVGAGELKASASGRMHGVHFVAAEAVVVVPSKEGVPLSAEGATFASAVGEIHLSARVAPDTKALMVTVTVPRAKVTIPNRSTQNLQSLDPDITVDVGIRQANGALAPPQLRPGVAKALKNAAAKSRSLSTTKNPDAIVARFTVGLGNEVELEGRGLKLGLTGKTVVEIAEELAVTGQISLKNGGTIDVQGRKFVVDRGTVTFVAGDEPSDPIVIAAAYWDAPDRTRVWVEFNGPLRTGKLTLRSDPPYSKNEILAILLFGQVDPNAGPAGGGERPSDAQQATAVGTGIASSGLNQALGELDDDFELEQDRTSANRVRTKLGYRLRRNLKVEIGYASGFSLREPDTTYLFLEWLFIPQWSLVGTRGDRGTSILDVLFQHRY